jgi:aminomethyltransferase
LGARDTLRLEKGYLLSGQDFDGRQTPLEVGYERLVRWDRRFLGRDPLLQLKERGGYRILKGILLKERGVPRPGSRVFWSSKSVGWLTSGTISPSLRAGIGLGYLDPEVAAEGNDVEVEVRDRRLRAEVVGTPFL